tara:strand:+ start:385 stop:591 length:207 start_codon:yes stop_codon:yes gene_type:complete
MKTIKLTKRQYEVLRLGFIQGASSHLDTLNDEAWDVDENLISKKALKNYNAYMRVIKKLEVKLNCIVP